MLVLVGTLRAIATLGGGTNKKTGEVIPLRDVLQIETKDNRGLVQMTTITVPDNKLYAAQINKEIKLPVRAWVPGQTVNFVYEPVQGVAA